MQQIKDLLTIANYKFGTQSKDEVINLLYDVGCVKFGKYILKSGVEAPYYLNFRRIHYDALKPLCKFIIQQFFNTKKDKQDVVLAGVPYGAYCLSNVVAFDAGLCHEYFTKEEKSYGDPNVDSGFSFDREKYKLIIVDDVISSGSSIQDMIDKCKQKGWTIKSVIVVIEREQNGVEKLRLNNKDITFNYLFKISDVLRTLKESGRIDSETCEKTLKWISENKMDVNK